MAGAKPDSTDLSQDGVETLRDAFRAKFSGDATIRGAIDGVLGEISDFWDRNSGGADPADVDLMKRDLSPTLDKLLGVPSNDAKALTDALVGAWETIRGRLK